MGVGRAWDGEKDGLEGRGGREGTGARALGVCGGRGERELEYASVQKL